MPLASTPPPGTPVPFAITRWAAAHGRRVDSLVWRNELGGLTARLVGPDEQPLYAKWSPEDLLPEAERLSWLASRFPSPRMADYEEVDDGWLIVTLGMPGESAVGSVGMADPDRAAAAIGEGLAILHSLDPTDCPFGPADWIGYQDDVNLLVVAHGDACAPNTLIDAAGAFVGIVDVGDLGVADRWADLAIASWSLEWNFGPGHEDALWAGYGEAPDPERIRRYRTLWGNP
ncbi:phosphotransferase [Tessaracoccus lapidicaptus]|uniref:phosphotransferase n=1 Tax=Tessaracoccus lapidicaptus TaxID=1427523 RepID=UPI00333E7790